MGKQKKVREAALAGGVESLNASQPAGGLASRQALHILIIVVLGLLVYSNTFQSPFQWDEEDYIVGNPIVRDLGFFAEPSRAAGLPVYNGLKLRYIGYLTFALNYKLHGFNVFGYHVTNLIIHLLNAILVYFLVLLTFRTPFMMGQGSGVKGQQSGDLRFTAHESRLLAFAVALFFVAHPIQTEAVTYIFQRLASLASLFYMLSLVLYIKGRQSAISGQQSATSPLKGGSGLSLLYYFLSLLSAVLAMKTKETAFTLPVVIALYEFLFFSGPVKKRGLRLAPFILTMLIIPLTIRGLNISAEEVISQIKDPASLGYQEISKADYLFTQFRVIVTYIRLLFLPINQNLGYDYPLYHTLFTTPVFFSFLFLSGIFGLAVWLVFISRQEARGKGQEAKDEKQGSASPIAFYRLIAFGILWFFTTLSVESSLIPIPMVIDEYRVYLPSVGFFIALLSGIICLVQRFSGKSLRFKPIFVIFGIVIIALASTTYARNILWRDKVKLWEDVVKKSPKLPSARINLGISYKDAGLREKALEQYQIAAGLSPDSSMAYMNMGNVLDVMGRLDEAIKEYEIALRLQPDNWLVRLNTGSAYGKKGWTDKAIEQLEAALKLNPYSEAAFNNLGNAYSQKGEINKAIEYYQTALKLSPDYAEANYNIGKTYEEKGENDKAADYYLSALKSRPDYVEAHYNLGRVYVKLKRPDEAIEQLASAVKLSPDNAPYHNTLGVLYAQKGSYSEAIEQFEAAVRLAPSEPSFLRNLERAKGMKSEK